MEPKFNRIISRLRKASFKLSANTKDRIHTAEEIVDDGTPGKASDEDINAFTSEFGEYTNLHGKISPLVYLGKKYADDIVNFMMGNGTKNELSSFVESKIHEIQDKAKEMKIPSSVYDACSDNYITKMTTKINRAKNVMKAGEYVYNALLAGDNLNVAALLEDEKNKK